MINNNQATWKSYKQVLPQHADHAGVMWHGSYLNWLEESRIEALLKVGISYSQLTLRGFDLPVVSLDINYKKAIYHGENVCLVSQVSKINGLRILWNTEFVKDQELIIAEANVELVLVRKVDGVMKLLRNYPETFDIALKELINGNN
tara:strand:- start:73 stop:513 length:441 start_codon:yes stop_codon:yes gene_type:complete